MSVIGKKTLKQLCWESYNIHSLLNKSHFKSVMSIMSQYLERQRCHLARCSLHTSDCSYSYVALGLWRSLERYTGWMVGGAFCLNNLSTQPCNAKSQSLLTLKLPGVRSNFKTKLNFFFFSKL